MSRPTPEPDDVRPVLRRYLLETLEPAEREDLERELAVSAQWRATLEAEREALAALDALHDSAPPPRMSMAVMSRVRDVEDGNRGQTAFRVRRRAVELAAAAVIILVMAAVLLPALPRARESARRSSPANNLKQMGLVFKMYSTEAQRQNFPPLAPYNGVWMMDLRTIYPEYLTDPAVLVNPGQEYGFDPLKRYQELLSASPVDWEKVDRLAADSYVYFGWVVRNDADVKALAAAPAESKLDTEADFVEVDGRKLFRLREGVGKSFVEDANDLAALAQAQAEIPVMTETRPGVSGGRNVLYLDGHVAFVARGVFPCTSAVEQALGLPSK
jgi:prepilin-type processing-associated H-X9-DG protein